jgi:hypothetical protein
MLGAGKDLLDRLPESQRGVADRETGPDLESTPFDIDEELAPALRALSPPCLEPGADRRGLDEAFTALLAKHGRPTDLKTALRRSVEDTGKKPAAGSVTRGGGRKTPATTTGDL